MSGYVFLLRKKILADQPGYETIPAWEQLIANIALGEHVKHLKQALLERIDDISEIWKPLTGYLKKLALNGLNEQDKAKLEYIKHFGSLVICVVKNYNKNSIL